METHQLPVFLGKAKDYQMWWIRFKAFLTANGFKAAINRKIDPNMPVDDAEVLDLNTADRKLAAAAKKQNELAMASLTMAFQTDRMIGMVAASTDTAWPNGLASRIIEALHKKYVPQDQISMIEMRQ